jgi:TetR/AcrR family transcriptional regulator, acrAB operon repressor
MVRRTKEEAQETRNRILDAAEQVFLERGVSRTSLNEIATAAGVTRGAIYWHFQDKSAVFNEMMTRVTLPFEETMRRIDDPDTDPIAALRAGLEGAFARAVGNPQARRVFEIATYKVEYVEETEAVRQRHVAHRGEKLEQFRRALARSAERGDLQLTLPVPVLADGLHALVSGLFQNWLLDPAAFDLIEVGTGAFDTFMAGLKYHHA